LVTTTRCQNAKDNNPNLNRRFQDETGVFLGLLIPTKEGGDMNGEEVFLPEKPAYLVSSRKCHAVPYMLGTNSKEALTFLSCE
jgi:hypothetical protein